MRHVLALLACFAVGGIAVAKASAQSSSNLAEQAATLVARPPVAPDIASFPRLAGGVGPASRIDATLDGIENKLRGAVEDCRKQARENDGQAGWRRTVRVSMRGPRFLSMTAEDGAFCGSAHPTNEMLALVFDLSTGKPVNWQRMLPPSLVQSTVLASGLAGSPIRLVKSDQLLALYKSHYPAHPDNIDPADRDACLDSVEDGFTLWLDAASHSLVLEPTAGDFATAACAVPVSLPVPLLAQIGIASTLLDTLRSGK
ncbi:MAG: hypothetical protein ACRYFY_05135 [Janthinobacterium lividum]